MQRKAIWCGLGLLAAGCVVVWGELAAVVANLVDDAIRDDVGPTTYAIAVKQEMPPDALFDTPPECEEVRPIEEQCDGSFEGPATNGTIGIGGGAGSQLRSMRGYGIREVGGGRAAMNLPAGGAVAWSADLDAGALAQCEPSNTEGYAHLAENSFRRVADSPVSTFSADVDTASYSLVRRMLTEGQLPPAGAVRIEEMVNYFRYRYDGPTGDVPFAVHVDAASCPWTDGHRLVRIALAGRRIEHVARTPANLVFLVDVSGSMQSADKLPLVQQSLRLLANELAPEDRVAIAVYAGASGLVLPSTSAAERSTIVDAIDRLSAGGSTNGGAGIRLAYATARASFVTGGVNRVVLATDGDFNVGTTSHAELVRLVQEEAKSGVFLSVLGFGRGNVKDDTMELLADKGNGNYAYIDSLQEARKVLVEQMGGTLVTIAKDVKLQVEWNPAHVAAYRLLGYENRMLAREDFNDDRKDAGEIGAGHTVTAFYEVVPAGAATNVVAADPLKYQQVAPAPESDSAEALTLKLRWKAPDGDTSRLVEVPYVDRGARFEQASADFRFAASVVSFGMQLRGSEHRGAATFDSALETASACLGDDTDGLRAGFVALVRRAKELSAPPTR